MNIILIWIVLSFIVAALGRDRECGVIYALLCSLIFSPVVGIIWVCLSKRKQTQTELLNEAKIYLETGVLNQDQYERMINDIVSTGKRKDVDKYKYKIVDPFKH